MHWEPIGGWLALASVARAILDTAAAIHRHKKPEPLAWTTLWESFRGYHYSVSDPRYTTEPKFSEVEGKWVVSGAVQWWLNVAGVHPAFHWDEQGPRVAFGYGTFGALALQLMRAVSAAHALSVCSGCGDTYIRPNRAPQSGRPNYCPTCGPKTANKLRQRAHRAKGAKR